MSTRRSIIDKLNAYGRRKKRLTAERGLSLILGGLCATLFVAVLGDRTLFLPAGARLAVLVLLSVASAAALAGLVAAPLMARTRTRRLAVDVQDRFPELGDRVLTAVELSARPEGDPSSETLVQAVLADAEKSTAHVDFRRACDTRSLIRALLGLSLVCLITAAYAVAHPLPFASCMRRLIDPYGGHAVYTYTSLDVEPKDGVVARGASLEIRAGTSGAVPDTATCYLKRGEGVWQRLVRPHDGGGVFTFPADNIHESTAYVVRAGDARSPVYRVNPIDRPEAVRVTVTCRHPAYTRIPPAVIENPTGGFSVVRGGTYRLSVGTNRPVAEVRLTSGDLDIQCVPTGDGTWDSGEVKPEGDCTAGIHVEDEHGIGGAEPARYRVTVRDDEVPVLTVEEPVGDLAVLVDEIVRIKASVSDDFGLISVEMPFGVLPGEGRFGRKLLASSLEQERDLSVSYAWRIADHSVEPGERIDFILEATDNCEPEAQVVRSRPYSILILSKAEHLARLAREQEHIAMRMGRLLRRQVEETGNTESVALLDDEQIVSDDVTKKAERGSEAQDGLSKEAAELARSLARLLEGMRKNSLVEEGSMVELASVGKSLGEMSGGDMRDAAARLHEGASETASSDRRTALRRASRTQHGVSERLRELLERVRRDSEMSTISGIRERLRELAARERALMGDVGMVAPRTAGRAAADLPDGEKTVLGGLSERQERILGGTRDVLAHMEEAVTQLSFMKSPHAERVDEVRAFIEEKKVPSRMSGVMSSISDNKLFTCIGDGKGIALHLEEAADMLEGLERPRDRVLTPAMLDDLIGRQEELKEELAELMKKAGDDESLAQAVRELQEKQKRLAGELAKALETARRMNRQLLGAMEGLCGDMASALGSMGEAGSAMAQGDMKGGAAEQGEALESLRKARDAMKALIAGGMEKLKKMAEAVRALREILGEQKDVARNTQLFRDEHGKGPHEDARGLALAPVTRRQKELKEKTDEVVKNWPRFLAGAEHLRGAAGEMDTSSGLMGSGLTDDAVRAAQDKAIALLEAMMGEGGSSMQGMGQAGMSLEMLLMLLAAPGFGGQGYDGGTIMFVPDKELKQGEQEWAKLAPRVRKRILEGWDKSYPPEFRELLEIYFEGIRQN